MNKNSIYEFKKLSRGMKERNHHRIKNRKNIDIVEDIEILKIKLIDIEKYLNGQDIMYIIDYLSKITYLSNLPNFILEKPEIENFWMTIWKYQLHSAENRIIMKILYRRNTNIYNSVSGYIDNDDIYSYAVYTTLDLLIDYFYNYIFSIIMNRDKYIDPIKFQS